MKRTITILTIALVGLSACTETNLMPDGVHKGRQIQFTLSPIKTTQTRAATITAFDQSQTFGSTAYAIDTTVNKSYDWLNNSTDATVTAIEKKEISYQSGVWRSKDNTSYWWDDFAGKKLTFLSWNPMTFSNTLVNSDNLTIKDQSKTTGSSTVNYKDFNYPEWKVSATAGFGYTKDTDGNYIRKTDDGSVDLLLAKSADCTEKNSSNGVLTQFYHQLCNVKFLASIVDEPQNGEKWYVTKVELTDIYTQADLVKAATQDVYSGIWSGHTASSTYTYDLSSSPIELKHTDPATDQEIFPQTLMIPQSVFSENGRTPTIKITYTNENNDSKTMAGALATNSQTDLTVWYAGKSITYHINISTMDYWIDFSASVESWTDGNGYQITIGN